MGKGNAAMRLSLALIVCAAFLGACSRKPDYVANPYFSDKKFAQVKPGMTGDEVRDLLGCPLDRFGPIAEDGGRVDWNYTFPAEVTTGPVRFHQFTVAFGSDGKVRKAQMNQAGMEWSPGLADSAFSARNLKRRIGAFHLIRSDRSTETLRPDDARLHVILLDRERRGGGARINNGPKWFEEERDELLRAGTIASVKHAYLGNDPEEYMTLANPLGAAEARNCFIDVKPAVELSNRDLDSEILLYKSGALYSMPRLPFSNPDDGIADQKWLIQRLAKER
jgi:outer membrane protein assembly factor BamE (lipoprotein component of BamABCDE complex)